MGEVREDNEENINNTMLDTEWIKNYKELEDEYTIFYKSEVKTIELLFYYRTQENEVEINNEELELVEKIDEYGYCKKVIPFETLQQIIKNNATREGKNYNLKAIYKYNFLYDTENIINNDIDAIKNNDIDAINNDLFLTQIKVGDKKDIVFEKTIVFFHVLNALYVIYTA